MLRRTDLLALQDAALHAGSVGNIARDSRTIHAAYRYPARFSPRFAGAAIAAFSGRGDTVLDPFCGGGTTGIEAIRLGRNAVISDLSPLAVFLSRAKIQTYSTRALVRVEDWCDRCENANALDLLRTSASMDEPDFRLGVLRSSELRYIYAALATWSMWAEELGTAQDLARLCLLRCGQRALDLRKTIPSLADLRKILRESVDQTVLAALRHADEIRDLRLTTSFSVKCRSAASVDLQTLRKFPRPTLAVFSPPYPGVHVLYPRWQVLGRRETDAPFWLARVRGETRESHYTMGRRGIEHTSEYVNLYGPSMSALHAHLDDGAYVVQMIGFHDIHSQLPPILQAMRRAGFREKRFQSLATASDGRLWRRVPGRKWYAAIHSARSSSSQEVVLIHRKM